MKTALAVLALLLAAATVAAQEDPKEKPPGKEDPKKEDPKKEDPKKEAPPKKKDPPKKKPDDPKKTFLLAVGKSFLKGDAAAIGAHFKKKGKIELKLKGIKDGKYREKQARSLLAAWLKKIEPKEMKLEEVGSSSGRFKAKYKVRADGKVVAGKVHVYLEKEGKSWLIVGIVES
ncbi:MAG: DUF4783 domain-containing protein [Planctomycetota bacterium]|jgi:hypothetical protein